jgi:hypothetical protein
MHQSAGRFESLRLLQRARHGQRLWIATLVGGLIAVLLYQTQWPGLRPGLLVLLAGQAGDVLALSWRRWQLTRLETLQTEERFMRRLARFDLVSQTTGFLILGYAIWTSTGNLWLAAGIGVVYPVTAYFGITRARNAAALRNLAAWKTHERK